MRKGERKKKKRASTDSNDPTYHSVAGQQFCLQAEKQPFPHSCTGRNLVVVIPLGVSLDVGSTTCFCTAHWHCWLLKSCEYKEWCCLAKSPANCSQEEDASCFSESGGVPLDVSVFWSRGENLLVLVYQVCKWKKSLIR